MRWVLSQSGSTVPTQLIAHDSSPCLFPTCSTSSPSSSSLPCRRVISGFLPSSCVGTFPRCCLERWNSETAAGGAAVELRWWRLFGGGRLLGCGGATDARGCGDLHWPRRPLNLKAASQGVLLARGHAGHWEGCRAAPPRLQAIPSRPPPGDADKIMKPGGQRRQGKSSIYRSSGRCRTRCPLAAAALRGRSRGELPCLPTEPPRLGDDSLFYLIFFGGIGEKRREPERSTPPTPTTEAVAVGGLRVLTLIGAQFPIPHWSMSVFVICACSSLEIRSG
jgi:hypothetical protein